MPRPTDMKVIEQRAWRTDTLMVFAKRHSKWLTGMKYNEKGKCYELSAEQLARLQLLVGEAGSGRREIIDGQ